MSPVRIAALILLTLGVVPARGQTVRRVAAILVTVPGKKPLTATREQVAAALFARTDSVATRYRRMSYGQLEIFGGAADVLGPFAVADPGDFCKTGLGRLADAADAAARASGADVASYDDVVYVIPPDMSCWWVGLGLIGGRRVWVKAATTRALDHELGHNLGMNHALFWENSASEASDLMGTADFGLNAPHVVQLGWLNAYDGKVGELDSAETLTLETLEADPRRSARAKIAIARPTSGGNAYYMSYRAAGPYAGGLNVHVYNGAARDAGFTRLVRVLKNGETFSDGPLRIRQISHTDDDVRAAVDWKGTGRALHAGGPPAAAGTIQSLSSSKCLDVARGSKADGAPVVQWTCHAGLNQQWRLEESGDAYEIVNVNSGKCLEVRAGAAVQTACADRDEQRWTAEPSAAGQALRNAALGRCLDLPHASTSDGVQPGLWECHGGPNQEWSLAAGQ